MTSFLLGAACFVLAMVIVSLSRILSGPTAADRMMATQLIGTGGVAALLLYSIATRTASVVDVALMLALLAAFASVAFVRSASGPEAEASGANESR